MANKFELTETARDDLKQIWIYSAERSRDSADKLLRELAKKFELLAENPKLGRSQNEFIYNLRGFPYKNYTLFYFPTEKGIEIYRVLHGARNIEDLFETYFEGLKP
ncbi:MAG: type II toxin-antitoxin system RelE/ParE family toxin [Acidobacteriota bacterium]|nr:type II toxin-antitoxin system RelE/ParE family toxin [Acidobacteriota bacterium]